MKSSSGFGPCNYVVLGNIPVKTIKAWVDTFFSIKLLPLKKNSEVIKSLKNIPKDYTPFKYLANLPQHLLECAGMWLCSFICLRDVAGGKQKMTWLCLSTSSLEIHSLLILLASRLAKGGLFVHFLLFKSQHRSGTRHQSNVTALSVVDISMGSRWVWKS